MCMRSVLKRMAVERDYRPVNMPKEYVTVPMPVAPGHGCRGGCGGGGNRDGVELLPSPGGGRVAHMSAAKCETGWGDGLSAGSGAPVERFSPHPLGAARDRPSPSRGG